MQDHDDDDFDEDLDFEDPVRVMDQLHEDLEGELEEETLGASGAPVPHLPMSRREMDNIVDRVLAEEVRRLKAAKKE